MRLGQGDVLTTMQDALEAGRCVLVENMGETIDAALMPIIARSTFRKGRGTYVRLGGKDVQWHPRFRLVLHTKLTNPHYPPDVQVCFGTLPISPTKSALPFWATCLFSHTPF